VKRLIRVFLVLLPVIAVLALGGAATGSRHHGNILTMAAKGQIGPAKIVMHVTRADGSTATIVKRMPWISAGALAAAQDSLGLSKVDPERLQHADGTVDANVGANLKTAPAGTANGNDNGKGGDEGRGNNLLGMRPNTLGCSGRTSNGNVRVNQDCTYRRNAEEENSFNPVDPNNLTAGQNDSRTGFNQCAFDWSTDNGHRWGDEIPPFRQKLNNPAGENPAPGDPNRHTIRGDDGTFHTYDADSDPITTVDAYGRAYFGCVAFDVATNASMLWVSSSPPGAQGSFYFNLGTFSRRFVVAEDNSAEIFHDKPFLTSDIYRKLPNGQTNPRAGNAYVTWTVFNFSDSCATKDNPSGYCKSPIFGSMTTDAGLHWSTPEEISASAPGICDKGNFFDTNAGPADCNQDQGSDPKVLPNGDLVVTFQNANGPGTALAQVLAVHCSPSGDSAAGTAHMNCAPPNRVSTQRLEGEPLCDFGRGPEECVPGAYIRTNAFPRIGVNRDNGHVYVTWQDYLRRDNGAKEWSIQLAKSVDGGVTWTGPVTINPDTGLDHYFPAIDIASKRGERGEHGSAGDNRDSGDRVGVSYYRTERVPSEATVPAEGFTPCDIPLFGGGTPCQAGVGASNSDYVLAGGTDLNAPYMFKVVSPVFPPPDGIQAGFNGDYSGLTINKGSDAHPIWSDTRNVDPYAPANGVVHDEDVFTDNVGLPNGRGKVEPGRIGKEHGEH
jgi:hypothetical protein